MNGRAQDPPETERGPVSLPAALFDRVDESDDAHFYSAPRFVNHIDEATIASLTACYARRLPAGGRILDLMSSWVSHLPENVDFARIEGLGMNAEELAANPRLDAWRVQNLNTTPALPWADGSFDAALIVVSVQYLTNPVAVFGEVGRVLASGGELLIAISHRCFPTKAVRAFRDLPPADRVRLLFECIEHTHRFEAPQFEDCSPADADPLWIVSARAL